MEHYLASAAAFHAEHAVASADGEFEDAIETAMRYRVACTRKWHATVLWTLSTLGPLTFGQLKARIGAGDEALSTALRGLTELQNVERDGDGGSPKYRMAPFGLFDMSLGMGAVYVYERIRSETEGRSTLVAYPG